jgi:Tfp pilus assembly protein PilF
MGGEVTGPVDVFVSYTEVDRAWAEWIAWQLEQAGYSVFVQAWDILPGQDFVHEMHRVSQRARQTMPVLSPAYLSSSEFGEAEWRVAFAADPGGQERRLVPVRVADCRPEGLLGTRVYIDLVGLGQVEARRALLAGLKEGGRPEGAPAFPASEVSGEVAPPRFPGGLPAVFNVPARSLSRLEGREGDLAEVEARLAAAGPAGVVALTGVGGVGKTRLLSEYAYGQVARFDVVWWVRGEEPIALLGDYAALIEAPGLPDPPPRGERGDTDDAVLAVRGWLEGHDRWLLLIDNVVDPTVLEGLLPRGGGGQVLLTSRADVGWAGVAVALPLGSLDEQAAARLLTDRSGDPDLSSARSLARRLGGLPLALEQAAGYVAESGGMSLAGYLQLFDTRSLELFERGRPADRNDTIATTWSLTLDRLTESVPAAVDLLVLVAHLAPDEVPTSLLAVNAEQLPAELGEVSADPLRLADTLRELRRFGMITASGETVGMHRVVQEVVRSRLDAETRGRWAAAAVQLLAAAFPGEVFNDPATWDDAERLLPHALSSAAHAEHAAVAGADASWLLDRAGSYLQARGQYRQAAGLLRRALAAGEAALGPDRPDIGTLRSNLGLVLQALGDLTGAREQLERALAISEAALGPDHPDIGTCRNNLGLVLQDLGDLTGAREQLERALAISEAALGPDHPDIGTRRNNLGRVLQAQGDLTGAREQYERALAISEAALGPDHPTVSTVRDRLRGVS